MSDTFWVAFFASLPATIAAFVAAILSIVNLLKLKTVHDQVNSKMQQLLDITAKSSKAEGVEQERTRAL